MPRAADIGLAVGRDQMARQTVIAIEVHSHCHCLDGRRIQRQMGA